MSRPRIVIVTPALAVANNGNWQTAQRWSRMLSRAYRVRVTDSWSGDDEGDAQDDLLIALHARRSASSIARWKTRDAVKPALLVLTGTDLYRDIAGDPLAQASLERADRLIVLNALGGRMLPSTLREKAHVILQSCGARRALDKSTARLRAVAVGHLRDEKSPRTLFEAVRALDDREDVFVDHVGAALDPALGDQARGLMAACRRYRWLGGLPHDVARGFIQRAHVLVHPSRIEGGAHVVIEAVRSGTPVVATRIDGNVGLLGEDYDGYFPVGDGAALAALLRRLRDEPAMLVHLGRQCDALADRFEPAHESATLQALIAGAIPSPCGSPLPAIPPRACGTSSV